VKGGRWKWGDGVGFDAGADFEEGGDGFAGVDADNGVGQEGSHAEHLGGHAGNLNLGCGVGGDELLDAGFLEAFDGDRTEDSVRHADVKVLGSVLAENLHG